MESVGVGDLVQAAGHAGPWTVLEVRHGMALLEHADGHRLSRRTTSLTVVRKAQPGPAAPAAESADSDGESPTLFD
ncbi:MULTISPECIES: hypothetical protein [Prescottella]|uniref:Uncharacterized protein n=2 Tax=Rhodococcus hoagii TaxID=43767 RepID=E9T4L1_RHOHA|nr:hypothetical protein [Prescottella equi]MBU4613643.1 hypothetical protein [Rhodococcus sp. GG48]MCD7051576.1 hypothetical protein [Rhodococcus sp. BH2-1]GBF13164.1 hypothetical protein Br6_00515 [Rhodococcus sp. Br-6]EGD22883.1 hypothetical protein HMPREF0724_13431 [Prescottella equi ATCC 33707]ERN45129.1 hypothetical protein H849_15732 [Prescottella equi NBRC 101255 = C 7]